MTRKSDFSAGLAAISRGSHFYGPEIYDQPSLRFQAPQVQRSGTFAQGLGFLIFELPLWQLVLAATEICAEVHLATGHLHFHSRLGGCRQVDGLLLLRPGATKWPHRTASGVDRAGLFLGCERGGG